MDGVINDGPPQPTHVPASTPHVLRDDEEYYQVADDFTPVVEEVDFGRPRTVWVRKPAYWAIRKKQGAADTSGAGTGGAGAGGVGMVGGPADDLSKEDANASTAVRYPPSRYSVSAVCPYPCILCAVSAVSAPTSHPGE